MPRMLLLLSVFTLALARRRDRRCRRRDRHAHRAEAGGSRSGRQGPAPSTDRRPLSGRLHRFDRAERARPERQTAYFGLVRDRLRRKLLRVFEIAGLDKVFTFHATCAEAIAMTRQLQGARLRRGFSFASRLSLRICCARVSACATTSTSSWTKIDGSRSLSMRHAPTLFATAAANRARDQPRLLEEADLELLFAAAVAKSVGACLIDGEHDLVDGLFVQAVEVEVVAQALTRAQQMRRLRRDANEKPRRSRAP